MTDTRKYNPIRVLEALRKSFARRNLIDFTTYTYTKYRPNWHHYLIADRLEQLAKGNIERLAINIPPRHGKTELVSVRFPAWYFGNNPNQNIIAVSYNAKLAENIGKKARNIVASIEFKKVFKNVQLSEESAAKLNWTLETSIHNQPCPHCNTINWQKKTFGRAICKTCGQLGEFAGSRTIGEYFGAGIGGGITGRGADILIIDDPHKDRAEANSDTIRDNVWEWYTSAAYQRLEKSGRICICQTRWHEDDLTGRAISQAYANNENWHILSLQAIAEDDEEFEIYNPDYIRVLGTNILRRKKGEALWEKYPINKLLDIKSTIGLYEFNAQYQQHPQPPEGGLFKRENFRYCTYENEIFVLKNNHTTKYINPHYNTRFFTIDLASRSNNNADFTVICVWDLTPENDLILHYMYRKRIEGAEHLNIIQSLYELYNPHEINIESTAYQITLIQSALKLGLPVRELKADKDKFTRALPAAALFEAHKIYLLKNLNDLSEIEHELTNFPNSKHDDIVDCFSYAAARASNIKRLHFALPQAKSILNRRKLILETLK